MKKVTPGAYLDEIKFCVSQAKHYITCNCIDESLPIMLSDESFETLTTTIESTVFILNTLQKIYKNQTGRYYFC